MNCEATTSPPTTPKNSWSTKSPRTPGVSAATAAWKPPPPLHAPQAAIRAVSNIFPLYQRFMTAPAERGLHKSLATLRQLQKDRGFVPQSSATRHSHRTTRPTRSRAF